MLVNLFKNIPDHSYCPATPGGTPDCARAQSYAHNSVLGIQVYTISYFTFARFTSLVKSLLWCSEVGGFRVVQSPWVMKWGWLWYHKKRASSHRALKRC
jgi:hypothetical protein